MSEWKPAKVKPCESGDFLCRVLIPKRGGEAKVNYDVIWFDILDKKWNCDEIIITHWMPLPEPPMELDWLNPPPEPSMDGWSENAKELYKNVMDSLSDD